MWLFPALDLEIDPRRPQTPGVTKFAALGDPGFAKVRNHGVRDPSR